MDPSDRPPGFMGATIIDVDIDAANDMNSDLPTWLRDVLDRALSTSGIRTRKKTASEDAINSLKELSLLDVKDHNCPICFDPYEEQKANKSDDTKNDGQDEGVAAQNMNNKAIEQNGAICENLQSLYNINNVQSMEHGQQFNDPSLFFPVDEGALITSRFPVRNLYTLQNASSEQILPGYKEENTGDDNNNEKDKDKSHVPVKMPDCDHIFGRSCIIEWLKGNVSCPLCRKEVEAQKETDPKIAKRDNIRDNSFYNFNPDQDGVVDHILNHLTDIFNPFRRPFNPSITPLTDSYMHQDWATPYFTVDGSSPGPISSRDPHLVLPRRFPFSEGSSSIPFMPLRHRVRDMRRETRRDNAQATDSRTNEEQLSQSSTEQPPQSNNRLEGANQTSNLSRNDPGSTTSSWTELRGSLPAANGTGGPERTIRNRTANGRSHPYVRPSLD